MSSISSTQMWSINSDNLRQALLGLNTAVIYDIFTIKRQHNQRLVNVVGMLTLIDGINYIWICIYNWH